MAEGKLFINGTQHFDGEQIGVNADMPIDKITMDDYGIDVWLNNYPPGPPTSFIATDGTSGVTCTWVNPVDDGVPDATYNLFENDVQVATNIVSGYVHPVTPGTRTYFVRAINVAGHADSNTDSGTSIQPHGSQTFTSSGSWVCPAGVYSVTIDMVGGGGSGGSKVDESGPNGGAGGGYAASRYQGTVAVSPEAIHTITVGGGGSSVIDNWGNSGGTSSALGKSAGGGSGGTVAGIGAAYAGNGGNDGNYFTWGDGVSYGGQGSAFARGGNAGGGDGFYYPPAGGVGAGGGGWISEDWRGAGGVGGRGEVRLTW